MSKQVAEGVRDKISRRMKANYADPSFRQKVKDAREASGADEKIRLTRTPELRSKIGAGAKKSWTDPGQLRKRIETLLRKLEGIEGLPSNTLEIRDTSGCFKKT